MRFYCTYFDKNYLTRALALHASLKRCGEPFRLYTLCWDDTAAQGIKNENLTDAIVVRPEQVEAYEPRLKEVRPTRSKIEYYFTVGPAFLEFVFSIDPEVDLLTYLDSDLYFFSSPEPIFEELGKNSIGIIDHCFSPSLIECRENGIYNVGWNMFRRDSFGLECLKWWKDRCIEWCFDYVDGPRFADQKYLDDWPVRFKGVCVLKNPGANLACWNIANYRLEKGEKGLLVDGHPLIFYHFHGFKEIRPWLFDSSLRSSGLRLNSFLKNNLFMPYLKELFRQTNGYHLAPLPRETNVRNPILKIIRKLHHTIYDLWTGSYLVYKPSNSDPPSRE